MGQYYLIVNPDKKEFIHPHKFGDGMKLLEFGSSGSGTMCALAILLKHSNGSGGGDINSNHPIVGSWAGCRISIEGDYDETQDFMSPEEVELSLEREDKLSKLPANATLAVVEPKEPSNLYCFADQHYKDVSDEVLDAMADDGYLRGELKGRLEGRRNSGVGSDLPPMLDKKIFGDAVKKKTKI